MVEEGYDTILEAIRADVMAAGGMKKVGTALRGEATDAETARRWLSDCLNEHRAEKLGLDELVAVIRMAKQKGSHVTMLYLADQCGFTRPRPVETADEKARAQRDLMNLLSELPDVVARAESVLGKLGQGE